MTITKNVNFPQKKLTFFLIFFNKKKSGTFFCKKLRKNSGFPKKLDMAPKIRILKIFIIIKYKISQIISIE